MLACKACMPITRSKAICEDSAQGGKDGETTACVGRCSAVQQRVLLDCQWLVVLGAVALTSRPTRVACSTGNGWHPGALCHACLRPAPHPHSLVQLVTPIRTCPGVQMPLAGADPLAAAVVTGHGRPLLDAVLRGGAHAADGAAPASVHAGGGEEDGPASARALADAVEDARLAVEERLVASGMWRLPVRGRAVMLGFWRACWSLWPLPGVQALVRRGARVLVIRHGCP